MKLNKVELISKDNRIQLFIDGVKVNRLEALVIDRVSSRPKSRVTISFLCSLNTKEEMQATTNKQLNSKLLEELFSIISKLKPYEWQRVKTYVDKKYSSKQASVPMPSLEEFQDYSNLDFPGIKNQ